MYHNIFNLLLYHVLICMFNRTINNKLLNTSLICYCIVRANGFVIISKIACKINKIMNALLLRTFLRDWNVEFALLFRKMYACYVKEDTMRLTWATKIQKKQQFLWHTGKLFSLSTGQSINSLLNSEFDTVVTLLQDDITFGN